MRQDSSALRRTAYRKAAARLSGWGTNDSVDRTLLRSTRVVHTPAASQSLRTLTRTRTCVLYSNTASRGQHDKRASRFVYIFCVCMKWTCGFDHRSTRTFTAPPRARNTYAYFTSHTRTIAYTFDWRGAERSRTVDVSCETLANS